MSTIDSVDKVRFFKSLVSKNFSEAGAEIGLDKTYTNPNSLRGSAYRLYRIILGQAESLGIGPDIVELVSQAIERRKVMGGTEPKELIDMNHSSIINPEDTKQVILGGRNKAAMLLHKKMDRLAASKKLLDATTLTQLATTFGIFFDKAQILQGQATENIAVMAKIKDNITPEESLSMLLQMRETVGNDK